MSPVVLVAPTNIFKRQHITIFKLVLSSLSKCAQVSVYIIQTYVMSGGPWEILMDEKLTGYHFIYSLICSNVQENRYLRR